MDRSLVSKMKEMDKLLICVIEGVCKDRKGKGNCPFNVAVSDDLCICIGKGLHEAVDGLIKEDSL